MKKRQTSRPPARRNPNAEEWLKSTREAREALSEDVSPRILADELRNPAKQQSARTNFDKINEYLVEQYAKGVTDDILSEGTLTDDGKLEIAKQCLEILASLPKDVKIKAVSDIPLEMIYEIGELASIGSFIKLYVMVFGSPQAQPSLEAARKWLDSHRNDNPPAGSDKRMAVSEAIGWLGKQFNIEAIRVNDGDPYPVTVEPMKEGGVVTRYRIRGLSEHSGRITKPQAIGNTIDLR